jgi:DNA polymerase IV
LGGIAHYTHGVMTEAAHLTPIRRIAHLDMDAFYASVELLRYPQLKGLPVVIGGSRRATDEAFTKQSADVALSEIPIDAFPTLADYVGRGVITTATYAARQYGIGSAMGLMKAAKLCPTAVLLPVDFTAYKHYSRLFKQTILKVAPVMEDRGIDEVYIDLTDVPDGQKEGGRVLARLLQQEIFAATGLTCSIGVAPNKLLAKMASEFNKPNGISIVYDFDLQSKIWPLACRKINGIGPKADEKLARTGIFTIGDLAGKDRDWLIVNFGKHFGAWLNDVAWGRDDRPLSTYSEPVSISRETTFDRDLHAVRDKQTLGAILTRLCEQLSLDLKAKGYEGKTVGVKLRFDDFKIVSRDLSGTEYVQDAPTLRHRAGLCLTRVDLTRRLRLLGVRVGKLRKVGVADEANNLSDHAAKKANEMLGQAAVLPNQRELPW